MLHGELQTTLVSLTRIPLHFRFIQANATVLSDHPEITFQRAANMPDSSAPAHGARSLWKSGKARSWIGPPHQSVVVESRLFFPPIQRN